MDNLKKCSKCGKEFPATTTYFHRDSSHSDGLNSRCKECRKIKDTKPKTEAKEGFKICSRCFRELPANRNYFMKANKYKNGLYSYCKECQGSHFIIVPKYGFKICSKCNQELPVTIEYFRTHPRTKDGFFSYCRSCETEYKKQYYIKNKDRLAKNMKEYNNTHKKEIYEYHRKYVSENKEKVRCWYKKHADSEQGKKSRALYEIRRRPQRIKRYYENRERLLEEQKEYRKSEKGKELIKIHRQKRRSLKASLPSDYTIQMWKSCKDYFNQSCAYCGKSSKKLTQDHFIPLSKGGGYVCNNIIPACKHCNSSKNNRNFYEWYPMQAFYDLNRFAKIEKFINRRCFESASC